MSNEIAIPNKVAKINFLGRLIPWCLKFGCSFTLHNTVIQRPTMDTSKDRWAMGEDHELGRDGSLVDVSHLVNKKTILIPEIVFSKGDRHIRISAISWDELVKRVEYDHKRIYMELSVPMLGEE